MATTLDLTSFDPALKVRYSDARVKNMVYKNNPFLAMVPKMENFGGKNLVIPIQIGVPQGRSATYAKALANKYSSAHEDFTITRNHNYALADIDNETILASMGDSNAFMEAATVEIDGALHAVTRDLAGDLFKSGTGARAQVGAIGGGGKRVTLKEISDIVHFEVGMKLLVSGATDGGDLRASSLALQCTSIDRDNGYLYFGTAVTSYAATNDWAVNDYIYVEGDAQNGTSASKVKLVGLGGWLPASAPTAGESFFGVDRSTDTTRLGGLRVTGTGVSVEEALITAAARLYREGGSPNVVFLNPEHEADLDKSLSGRMRYDSAKAFDADISFESVRLRTSAGSVQVVADPNCPKGVAYMLTLDTWKLYSLGPAPQILRTDGLRFLRNASADSVEVRCGYYAQLGCTAPGYNARISLST